MVRYPLGGMMSWTLQWLVGLHRLGHEVIFVEKSHYSHSCYNPLTREYWLEANLDVNYMMHFRRPAAA